MPGPWPDWYDLLTAQALSRVRLTKARRRLVTAWREAGYTAVAARRCGVTRQAVYYALRQARRAIERQHP